ncbi:MAG TPA: hypothetical protein PK899_11470, partial [Spirochaetota bacterium]|nr:hypothetical protein [Spirochaetota bacterium]
MSAFLKKIIDTVKNIWDKTGLTQKLIAGAVILAFVVGIILLFSFNSGRAGVSLFSKALSEEDFERITAKLAEEKIQFTSKNRTNIYVKSQNEKNRAVMLLAEDGSIPKGSYTFKDIINSKNLTSSRFLNSVKLREALEGKLEKLLKASELIDSADVTFTMPEQTIYLSEKEPVKVAVMLTPAYKVDLKENKRAIKGIQELVVNSIDGATAEYVTITDNYGVKLNDFSDEEDINRLKITKDNLKTRNEIVENYRRKIIDALSKIISNDRLSLVVDVSMNFDQERENTTELLPVILKEDDPNTPYDDGER